MLHIFSFLLGLFVFYLTELFLLPFLFRIRVRPRVNNVAFIPTTLHLDLLKKSIPTCDNLSWFNVLVQRYFLELVMSYAYKYKFVENIYKKTKPMERFFKFRVTDTFFGHEAPVLSTVRLVAPKDLDNISKGLQSNPDLDTPCDFNNPMYLFDMEYNGTFSLSMDFTIKNITFPLTLIIYHISGPLVLRLPALNNHTRLEFSLLSLKRFEYKLETNMDNKILCKTINAILHKYFIRIFKSSFVYPKFAPKYLPTVIPSMRLIDYTYTKIDSDEMAEACLHYINLIMSMDFKYLEKINGVVIRRGNYFVNQTTNYIRMCDVDISEHLKRKEYNELTSINTGKNKKIEKIEKMDEISNTSKEDLKTVHELGDRLRNKSEKNHCKDKTNLKTFNFDESLSAVSNGVDLNGKLQELSKGDDLSSKDSFTEKKNAINEDSIYSADPNEETIKSMAEDINECIKKSELYNKQDFNAENKSGSDNNATGKKSNDENKGIPITGIFVDKPSSDLKSLNSDVNLVSKGAVQSLAALAQGKDGDQDNVKNKDKPVVPSTHNTEKREKVIDNYLLATFYENFITNLEIFKGVVADFQNIEEIEDFPLYTRTKLIFKTREYNFNRYINENGVVFQSEATQEFFAFKVRSLQVLEVFSYVQNTDFIITAKRMEGFRDKLITADLGVIRRRELKGSEKVRAMSDEKINQLIFEVKECVHENNGFLNFIDVRFEVDGDAVIKMLKEKNRTRLMLLFEMLEIRNVPVKRPFYSSFDVYVNQIRTKVYSVFEDNLIIDIVDNERIICCVGNCSLLRIYYFDEIRPSCFQKFIFGAKAELRLGDCFNNQKMDQLDVTGKLWETDITVSKSRILISFEVGLYDEIYIYIYNKTTRKYLLEKIKLRGRLMKFHRFILAIKPPAVISINIKSKQDSMHNKMLFGESNDIKEIVIDSCIELSRVKKFSHIFNGVDGYSLFYDLEDTGIFTQLINPASEEVIEGSGLVYVNECEYLTKFKNKKSGKLTMDMVVGMFLIEMDRK